MASIADRTNRRRRWRGLPARAFVRHNLYSSTAGIGWLSAANEMQLSLKRDPQNDVLSDLIGGYDFSGCIV